MRILVVEDEHRLADRHRRGAARPGHGRGRRHDGLDAAAKLDVNAYDVVVLDRDLPGIHGDALCQMIAARDQPPWC